jgi:hypothetical protein
MASTMTLFADGPIYCNASSEVQAVFNHLERIGIPLRQRMDEAMIYRKDASRIAALQELREKLRRVFEAFIIVGGTNLPPPAPAWRQPFFQSSINLTKMGLQICT